MFCVVFYCDKICAPGHSRVLLLDELSASNLWGITALEGGKFDLWYRGKEGREVLRAPLG